MANILEGVDFDLLEEFAHKLYLGEPKVGV